jgi:hypothetical protein
MGPCEYGPWGDEEGSDRAWYLATREARKHAETRGRSATTGWRTESTGRPAVEALMTWSLLINEGSGA